MPPGAFDPLVNEFVPMNFPMNHIPPCACAVERTLPHLSQYYDMTTFRGRLMYNWALCNPLGLRWGEHAVHQAQSTVTAFQQGEYVAHDDLQHAQTVLAVSAPQGVLAPAPCRTSGWGLATVPVMAYIVSNAISHPTSLLRIVLGQWLNQTQNAAITWFNRPSSSDSTGNANRQAAAAYAMACATAIPVAVAAGFAAQRVSFLKPFSRFAPYPGVAMANVMNTGMMRGNDLREGVHVYVPKGAAAAERMVPDAMASDGAKEGFVRDEALGKRLGVTSSTAGWRAVADTALTRTLIPLANFVAAPLLMGVIDRLRGPSRPRSLALQVGVTAATLITAIPLASSVSAPIGTISIDDVEPAVAAAAKAQAPGIRELWYERGF